MSLDYQKICFNILDILSPRNKEVIIQRFGLQDNKKETLENIGKKFGITRERVRQIEANSLNKIKELKKEKELKEIFSLINLELKNQGGLKREDILLSKLGNGRFDNFVYFFLVLGDDFYRFSENKEFYPFWSTEKNLVGRIKKILSDLVKVFEKKQRPITEEEFLALSGNEDKKFFVSAFEISKKIEKGPLNYIGLIDWSEIKPRGVKDRAYLALKKENKPLHFRDIASIASQIQGDIVPQKQVYPQTVHNELIKDDRFVLVGRGTYALKEWGYKPGKVKDIIAQVIKEADKPLSREEIIDNVLKQRVVKEGTILLNLQDKNMFKKDDEQRYHLV